MRMNSNSDIHQSPFGQFNRINNYSKAVEQLGDLNLAENESNLFGDENSDKTDHSDDLNLTEGIDFLKKLAQLKHNSANTKSSESLFSMIAHNKVVIKKDKIVKADEINEIEDVEMKNDEEIKDQFPNNKSPTQSKPPLLNDSLLVGDDLELVLENDLNKLNNTIQKDKNMNIEDEVESHHSDLPNNNMGGFDKYESIFIGIEQKKSKSNSLIDFDIPDPNGQFNYNNNNNIDPFNRMIPYSYDFLESEKPQTLLFQNNDMEINMRKGNKNYLAKMKKTLKDTLKKIIEDKKKERATQNQLIPQYREFWDKFLK